MRLWILRMHVACLATVLPDLSKLLSLSRLLQFFTPKSAASFYEGLAVEQVVTEVNHRLRWPWRMRGRKCLRRGLLLFYFLELSGYPAELHFGIYSDCPTRMKAHCWVTVNGLTVADPPDRPCGIVLRYGSREAG